MNLIKQIFVVGAVIAICMVFVLEFRPGTNVQGGAGPRCAIEVQGGCVPHNHYLASFRMIAPPNIDDQQIKALRLRETVIQGLIERSLLVQDAKRLGLTVTDQEVREHLFKGLVRVSLPVARADSFAMRLQLNGLPIVGQPEGPARRLYVRDRKTGNFDSKNFKSQMRRLTNMTMSGFTEYQKEEALAARMRAAIESRTRVSEAEARLAFGDKNEKAKVNYLKLEEPFVRAHIVDGDGAAIKAWMDENAETIEEAWGSAKERYTPGCRKARHILVRVDRAAEDQEEAKKAAKKTIEAARKKIAGGAAFGKVAADVSQDDLTASSGGKLGCFAAGKLAKPNTAKAIDEAVHSLGKGKVSAVIETNYGFHLVKVDDIVDGEKAEAVGRREVGEQMYFRKEGERLAAEGAKKIHAAIKGGKSMGDALETYFSEIEDEDRQKAARADERRPKVAQSGAFTKSQPAFPEVERAAETAKMVFELEKKGAVTKDVVKLYTGYAVVTLDERLGIDEKEWKEKRRDSIERMRKGKQRDALVAYVQRLRKERAKDLKVNVRLKTAEEEAEAKKPANAK